MCLQCNARLTRRRQLVSQLELFFRKSRKNRENKSVKCVEYCRGKHSIQPYPLNGLYFVRYYYLVQRRKVGIDFLCAQRLLPERKLPFLLPNLG